MKNASVVIALVVGIAFGLVVGHMTTGTSANAEPEAAGAAPTKALAHAGQGAAPTPTTVYKVPVGDGHVRGPATAPVTIIEFADYQCPFCERAYRTVTQLRQEYGNKIRVVFKNNPLSFHPYAAKAAEAAEAAGAQGKFWEYHDKLYENQQHITRPDLDTYAQAIGLDMDRFKKDVDGDAYKAKIEAQSREANALGAGGTPAFFINGVYIRGAQPLATFKATIDAQLAKAQKLLSSGVKPAALYDTIIAHGAATVARPKPQQQRQQPQFARVEIGPRDHVRGPANAKVTIVEWSDFQCPFCKRAEPTVEQILKTYGKEVRFVFKQQPLPFHKYAMGAAEASEAAAAQGKFWPYHDLLYKVSPALARPQLEQYAQQVGLNMTKFKSALDQHTYQARINADSVEGRKIGAGGTPTFFIDGRMVVGAQPFASFKSVIDQEMTKADALLKKGTPRTKLYQALLTENAKTFKNAPRPSAPAVDNTRYTIAIGSSPAIGPKNAPVTIIEWSDFQCPFCKRAEGTVSELLKEYKGKIRLVYKQQPLPMHQYAQMAAEASMAAKAQGKFWPYHDLLFKGSPNLARPQLEQYAQQIGLNMTKFKNALDQHTYKAEVSNDQSAGARVGANGTPTFFINGRKLVGAQPLSSFKAVIDSELAKHKK